MSDYFTNIPHIKYEGPKTSNPLAYRYYNPDQVILGKTMAEHLRFAVCCWHTFCWQGNDGFGEGTFNRPWLQSNDVQERSKMRVDAMFEFISKLNLPFFTFHDRDIAAEGGSLKKSIANLQVVTEYIGKKMQETGIQLLWGTANLFSHPRYMSGGATNPDAEVFAYAVAQVKAAFDATRELGGANYVLWGDEKVMKLF